MAVSTSDGLLLGTTAAGSLLSGILCGIEYVVLVVLRPLAEHTSEDALIELLGPIHRRGDRWLGPLAIAVGVCAAATTVIAALTEQAAPQMWSCAVFLASWLLWFALFATFAAPANKLIVQAYDQGNRPDDGRISRAQQRWNTVAGARFVTALVAAGASLAAVSISYHGI